MHLLDKVYIRLIIVSCHVLLFVQLSDPPKFIISRMPAYLDLSI